MSKVHVPENEWRKERRKQRFKNKKRDKKRNKFRHDRQLERFENEEYFDDMDDVEDYVLRRAGPRLR